MYVRHISNKHFAYLGMYIVSFLYDCNNIVLYCVQTYKMCNISLIKYNYCSAFCSWVLHVDHKVI